MDLNDNSLPVRAIRVTLKTCLLLAPPLFDKLAARLFFKPNRGKLRQQDADFLAGLNSLPTPDGLLAWSSPAAEPNGKRVLLLHGWSMRAAHMIPFVEMVNTAGYEAVLVDFPAHGAAAGEITHPPHTESLFHPWLEALNAEQVVTGIIGHSYGGVMGIRASYKVIEPEFIVGIATPNHYIFPEFADYMRFSERAKQRFLAAGEKITGGNLLNYTALDVPENYKTTVHLIHAENDTIATSKHDEAYKKVLPNCRVQVIGSGGHIRVLWDKAVMAAVKKVLEDVVL